MALMTSSTPPRGWPIESLPALTQQRQEVVKDVALRLVRDNVRRQAGVHERYFEELAAILAKPGSPDVQAIAALRKRYDTE